MKLKTNNTSVFTIPEMDRTIVLETRTLVKTSKPAQRRTALQSLAIGCAELE